MKTKLFLFLLVISGGLFSQSDTAQTKRFGVIGMVDYAFHSPDKVTGPGMFRRLSLGTSFTNKKRQFIGIAAAGFKLFKLSLASPSLQNSFLNDISKNYVAMTDTSEDRVIAHTMGRERGKGFAGTLGYYFQLGAMLNNKFSPFVLLSAGADMYTLYDDALSQYEDPEHGDINYVGMSATSYEIKFGCGLPSKEKIARPDRLNLTVGYKFIDYGEFKFGNTPLSAYTKGKLSEKYRYNTKFTISICYMAWSNWEGK